MSNTQILLTVLVIAVVTAALRFLPFIVFSSNKKTPHIVLYLGKVLPFAIMAMIVVYCLKSVELLSFPFALPELISVAVVALLHIWKRNSLLSIAVGTVCYMLLIQFVF